jgi:tetratricopeptide (TPR) repeat protein
MHGPPRRSDDEAEALVAEQLERLAPRRGALGEAGVHAVAGWTLVHAFEWEAAALAWARASALDPEDPEPPLQEGICLLELGRYEDAAARFRHAMEIDAGRRARGEDGVEWMEEDPAYRLGMALHAKGDLRAAIEAYEESARRNRTGVDALREAVRCRIALEEPSEALETLGRLERRAVRLTLRAEVMALRSEATRLLHERRP